MKNIKSPYYIIVLLLFVGACKSTHYSVNNTKVSTTRIVTTDSSFSVDSTILNIIAPYKSRLDSQMSVVVGYTEANLVKDRPNGNLNNFIADIIRTETSKQIGDDVDFAFTNISGLRIPSISKGNITKGKLFELLPFDNMIIIAKVNGETLKKVLQQIASKGGEAISGFKIIISEENTFMRATYNGALIDYTKDHIIATNDFLYNGGDGYTMFGDNTLKVYPVTTSIRDMVINHIIKLTATNVPINPKADERVTVQ